MAGTIELVVEWLEEVSAAGNGRRVGHLATALVNMRRGARASFVVDGFRRFPADRDDPFEGEPQSIPLEELAERLAPRLRAVARGEAPPRVMPAVLDAWGIEH